MPRWTRERAEQESAPAPGGQQDRAVLRRRALMRAVEERCRERGVKGTAMTAAVDEAMKVADKHWKK
jgi:hypothetical protein